LLRKKHIDKLVAYVLHLNKKPTKSIYRSLKLKGGLKIQCELFRGPKTEMKPRHCLDLKVEGRRVYTSVGSCLGS